MQRAVLVYRRFIQGLRGFRLDGFRAFRASKHLNTIYMDQHVNKASNTASRAPFISIHHCTSMAVNPINDLQELILRGDRRLRMTTAPFCTIQQCKSFNSATTGCKVFGSHTSWLSTVICRQISRGIFRSESNNDKTTLCTAQCPNHVAFPGHRIMLRTRFFRIKKMGIVFLQMV